MPARPRLFLSITTSTLMLCQPLCAFQTTLSDTAVREAYFLGQRHDQKTSDFLKLYAHAFPLPEKGPYISEIHLLSPYAQVVSNSSQHSTGYSAQQAAADYRSRGDTLLVKVRIEFTPTYTYQDAVQAAADTGRDLHRHFYPEDFWQAFRFTLSQNGQSPEPRDVRSDPIYATSSPTGATSTLRGAVVWLEFDAAAMECQPAQVEVITPAGQSVLAKFDLGKLG